MRDGTNSGAGRPAARPRADPAFDPAEVRGHLARARQLRAETTAGLIRRGLGHLARLVRRAGRRTPPRPGARDRPTPAGARAAGTGR